MDGARDAVLQLEVHLGDGVLGEDRGIGDVTCRDEMSVVVLGRQIRLSPLKREPGPGAMLHTNSSRLNHVADGESLDGLVLGRASRAVGATDGLDVAATLLVAAVVLSLQEESWSASCAVVISCAWRSTAMRSQGRVQPDSIVRLARAAEWKHRTQCNRDSKDEWGVIVPS